jgi:ribosomal protein S18 acetylase RimI-like enzyme
MVPRGWQAARPARRVAAPEWLGALEPLTTGLLAQESLRLWFAGSAAALGIRAGGVVYPVFPAPLDRSAVSGAKAILNRVGDQWCVMGPAPWVETALGLMPPSRITHRVAYDFLARPALDVVVPPGTGTLKAGSGVDTEALFSLQEGYEKEEVLFDPAEFQPLASRLHFWKLLKEQEIVSLWWGDRPVAKAGTNALTDHWGQVGGVYTRPELRGQGLQKRLMAFLLARLADQGRGACLFVKRANTAARALYASLGFESRGEFTIVYGDRLPWAPGFP